MGLQATITKAALVAFAAVGDLATPITFRHVTGSKYDAATGTTIETYDDHLVSGILYGYTAREVAVSGGTVRPTDQKFIAQQSDVPTDPSLMDYALINLVRWNVVVPVQQDPAGAIWIFQLRKP